MHTVWLVRRQDGCAYGEHEQPSAWPPARPPGLPARSCEESLTSRTRGRTN